MSVVMQTFSPWKCLLYVGGELAWAGIVMVNHWQQCQVWHGCWLGPGPVKWVSAFFMFIISFWKFFLSMRRKEKIKFSRNSICFLLLLIQQKQTASEICMFFWQPHSNKKKGSWRPLDYWNNWGCPVQILQLWGFELRGDAKAESSK